MIIFFDIDDTLVDQASSEKLAATRLWEALSFKDRLTLQDFKTEWERAKNISIKRYLEGEIDFTEQRRERIRYFFPESSIDDSTADSHFAIYKEEFESSWTLFSDVVPCLESLEGIRLGIISNGDSNQQRKKLKNTLIYDRFEKIIISGDTGVSKPGKGIFIEACKQMGTSTENCLYVGDNLETDIKGCTAVGMHGILIDRSSKSPSVNTDTIETLLELKNKMGEPDVAHNSGDCAPSA